MQSSNTVVDGSTESTQPDYSSIDVPTVPPAEYSWQQRRAELLQLVCQRGHPRALNQTEMAERYDVSQQQISKDLDRIASHVDETLGARRALISEAVFQRAIQGLIEEEEWRDAARTVSEWNEWITEYKDMQEIKDRLARLEEDRR